MMLNSVRARVAVIFGAFAAGLSLFWMFVFLSAVYLSEDRVVTNILNRTATPFFAHIENNRNTHFDLPDEMSSFVGEDELPGALDEWKHSPPKPGNYEFSDHDLHIAVTFSKAYDKNIYLVFNVKGIESTDGDDLVPSILLLVCSIFFTIVAVLLGINLGNRAVEPVTKLSAVIQSIDPANVNGGNLDQLDSSQFIEEEVGILSQSFKQALQRMCDFVERERYFTSDASHELRTPLTVIQGAVELLKSYELPTSSDNAIARIERASNEMRTTIQIFLELSREGDSDEFTKLFEVIPFLENAIQNHKFMLEDKNTEYVLIKKAEPNMYANSQAFGIAVNNLVRNAFEHSTAHGEPIAIKVLSNSIEVSNIHEAVTERKTQQGYGLGLKIVERLCQKNNWCFEFNRSSESTKARLEWKGI